MKMTTSNVINIYWINLIDLCIDKDNLSTLQKAIITYLIAFSLQDKQVCT